MIALKSLPDGVSKVLLFATVVWNVYKIGKKFSTKSRIDRNAERSLVEQQECLLKPFDYLDGLLQNDKNILFPMIQLNGAE